MEAGYNASTVALRVLKADVNGTKCLGVEVGHPVTEGYKYRTWSFRLGVGWGAENLTV
jgi:hypothetical protein